MDTLMLLANGFKPDPRVLKQIRSLGKAGIRVTLLCLDRDCNQVPEEVFEGTRIFRIRVGRVRTGKALSIGRALTLFYLKSIVTLRRLHKSTPFQLIHCHDLDTMPVSALLSRIWRVPLVYDLHDLYSSYFKRVELQWITQRIDQLFYRCSDRMVITHETFAPVIGSRAQMVTLMNVPPRAGGGAADETDAGFFYAGNLDRMRDMRWAVPLLAECGIRVTFAGVGPLFEQYRQLDTTRAIQFLGWITPEEVDETTRRCLAVLALYDTRVPNNRILAPNKLFDAMKFGKPAIVSDGTAMAEIVRKTASGVAVPYGDSGRLREAIEQLKDHTTYARFSRNAYQAFEDRYNWDLMEPRLISMYRELARAEPGLPRASPGDPDI